MSRPFPPRPRAYREVLDEAVGYLPRVSRSLWLPFAGLYTLATLSGLWAQRMAAGGGDGSLDPALGCGSYLALLALFLGGLLTLGVLSTLACLDTVAGRPVSLRSNLRALFRLPFLGTLILAGLATMVSYLFCVVPVVFVAPTLTLVIPVMREESRYGIGALNRSFQLGLVREGGKGVPMWVRLVGLWLISSSVAWGLTSVFQIPTQLLETWRAMRLLTGGDVPVGGLGSLVWLLVQGASQGVASAASALVLGFAVALVFFDSRERREGWSLEASLRALEEGSGGGAAPQEGAEP